MLVGVALTALPADAQRIDSTQAGVRIIEPPAARPPLPGTSDTTVLRPPISPRRAFLYSLLLPGAGQAKLDRATAGGFFFLIEATALVLVMRSGEDLRIARRFAGDSTPLGYRIDPTTGRAERDADGNPVVAEWGQPRYDQGWVRTRRLHREDWMAVLVFNHLFAGADAFVAAQLWDLPGKVGIRQTPFGPLLQATFSFR